MPRSLILIWSSCSKEVNKELGRKFPTLGEAIYFVTLIFTMAIVLLAYLGDEVALSLALIALITLFIETLLLNYSRDRVEELQFKRAKAEKVYRSFLVKTQLPQESFSEMIQMMEGYCNEGKRKDQKSRDVLLGAIFCTASTVVSELINRCLMGGDIASPQLAIDQSRRVEPI